MILYGYFRSSASWRVRIALNLKSVTTEQISRDLQGGEQHAPDYLQLNPQALVPTLMLDEGAVLTQSLAICEWLDETFPEPPLLPGSALERARIRAFALVIASDIHPVQGGRTQNRLRKLGIAEAEVTAWAQNAVMDGLAACEALLGPQERQFCFGPTPTLADICLIPQLANARRLGCFLEALPRLLAVEQACNALPAFVDARPERQPDARP